MIGSERLWSGALLAVAVAVAGGCGVGTAEDGRSAGEQLGTRRGDLERRLLLTGELEAADSLKIGIPRTRQFRVQITWLAADGAEVRAGDRVVEFDSSAFTTNLDEQRTAELRAERALEKITAEVEAAGVQAEMEVARRQLELDKARLDATVPEHILSRRDFQDRQLALTRAQNGYDKAIEARAVQRRAGEADIEVARIELATARREVAAAESAIELLTVTAPRDGVVVISQHPWEGRKIQVGDMLWIGLTVAELPDLERLRVRARLSDVDDGLVAVGTPVRCSLDAHPELTLAGQVQAVTPVAAEERGESLRSFFEVLVELDRSDSELMRPGMSVRVEVPLPVVSDTVIAPRTALDLDHQPPRARLADGSWHEVEPGPCGALECAIVSGLDAGIALAPAGTSL